MATKKWLIEREELISEIEILYQKHYVHSFDKTVHDIFNAVRKRIRRVPTVDAILVDDIILHHILIDNEGVPEVKLQFGDRYFTLHTDPVDVREVLHGQWIEEYAYDPDPHDRLRYKCSVCGRTEEYREPYCHCGAKMR